MRNLSEVRELPAATGHAGSGSRESSSRVHCLDPSSLRLLVCAAWAPACPGPSSGEQGVSGRGWEREGTGQEPAPVPAQQKRARMPATPIPRGQADGGC